MADFPNSTAASEFLRPIIESEIERLIGILDAMDPDPDLEPSLSFGRAHRSPAGQPAGLPCYRRQGKPLAVKPQYPPMIGSTSPVM